MGETGTMMNARKLRRAGQVLLTTCAAIALTPAIAKAQTGDQVQYSIHAPDLGTALTELARQSGREIYFSSELTRGLRAPKISGQLTVEQALDRLLDGTGLTYRLNSSGAIVIGSASGNGGAAGKTAASLGEATAASAAAGNESAERQAIVVTGTHIKHAPPASPIITITAEDARKAGQYTLGDVARSVPQNFNGGQNPGVMLGATGGSLTNANVTDGSSINLRGLGPDATLTLLNGRRLPYNGTYQSVDISTIPLDAVDRIEIVADGASALYGSDAVAGVANIILKRDYSGVTLSARLGSATEGGDFQQQYAAVGGAKWSTGGFIGTYNFEHDNAIYSDQRTYTRYLMMPNTLLPKQTSNSGILSLHQEIFPSLTFSVDATYSERRSFSAQTLTSTYESLTERRDVNYTISPEITYTPIGGWTFNVQGSLGRDHLHENSRNYNPGTGQLTQQTILCYCNQTTSVEANGEGPIVRLPAGAARAAVGGGYRENVFDQLYQTSTSTIRANSKSYYAFGELYVPIVSPEQRISGIDRLSISAAGRYEHYSSFGGVATPKIGVIYAPSSSVEMKTSWGRSFKTPTLLQLYQAQYAYLFPVQTLGGSAYPTSATALVAYGGNPSLKPERARTWTTTLAYHPVNVPGLNLSASYFDISYKDRIISPVSALTAAFSNPVYQEFLTFGPSSEQQQDVITSSSNGLTNFTDSSYDPNAVVAIVNDYYTNVARQRIRGVDIGGRYGFDWKGHIDLSGNATWLRSQQRNSATGAEFPLAGTVYNPPRFRARFGISWRTGAFNLASFLNHIGGVTNTNVTPHVNGRSMNTADVALLYDVGSASGPLRRLELAVAVQNLTDAKPPYLKNTSPYYVDYDSTNYSAIGRFINVSIRKHW
jgi:iron complex outermembrane recepter protein